MVLLTFSFGDGGMVVSMQTDQTQYSVRVEPLDCLRMGIEPNKLFAMMEHGTKFYHDHRTPAIVDGEVVKAQP